MRRAIISDIHGNLLALQAALADCKEQQVDNIVCLGDICGYGPDPLDCVDLIRSSCQWVLCGNHDAALFMSIAVGFNKYAKDAIEWQRSLLVPKWYSFSGKKRRWNWLENLPASRAEGRVLYVHASPRDPLMEYVEESDFADMGFGNSQKAVEIFEKIDMLSFCGHSHRPGVVTQEFVWMRPAELPNMSYRLQPGVKTLVNIGSVGQPRDNNPNCCYVIYDDQENSITFRRPSYDIPAEQERFRRVPQLSERLWKRLEIGS